MPIRIDWIKVNRGGPLGSDFEFEPGDLNLIYGHNETGKTYVVESMIKFLFRTSNRAPVNWNLRDWENIAGKVVVSGLDKDPVSFTKTGEKLEDYWEKGTGLPMDLSRLLVVKAGENQLAEGEEDGVGRGIIKNCLSGEGLLDKISTRISATLKSAKVQDGVITGDQRGEVKTRIECEERRDDLINLLNKAERDYASGDAYSLGQKKEAIEAELKELEMAKRYHAWQLHEKKQALHQEKNGLPTDDKLSTLKADIEIYDSKMTDVETNSVKLGKLEGTSEDLRWTEKALSDYSEIPAIPSPKPILMLIALFFGGVMITGFMGHNIPLVICGIGALVSFIIYSIINSTALANAGESKEMEDIKADFSRRFVGLELTNRPVLEAKLEELRDNHKDAIRLREEVNELDRKTTNNKSNITKALEEFTGESPGPEQQPQQWKESIKTIRSRIEKLEAEIRSQDKDLLLLAVLEKDHIDEDPGTEWDKGRYDNLDNESKETEKALEKKEAGFGQLKALIVQETRSKSTEWEILITELRDRLEEEEEKYRNLTAEILAKIKVNIAIQEFREKEDATIENGLKGQELTKPLRALTGRYDRIRQEKDSGLILMTDEDEEYPLTDISTGAREQIYLALRMGFASIAMEGQTTFLILDDAFQHSDWNRRKNIIGHTLDLVENGWQIFYFTMDDHIRDLFLEAGEKIGDGFRSHKLC